MITLFCIGFILALFYGTSAISWYFEKWPDSRLSRWFDKWANNGCDEDVEESKWHTLL